MLKRQYPIMMGLGTKILTAYHHPNFKNGLQSWTVRKNFQEVTMQATMN